MDFVISGTPRAASVPIIPIPPVESDLPGAEEPAAADDLEQDEARITPSTFDTPQAKQQSDRARARITGLTAAMPSKDVPAAKINRDQAIALLKKIGAVLHVECADHLLDAMLKELINSLEELPGQEIPMRLWAHLSLQCEKIACLLRQCYDLNQLGISPLRFIAQNLDHLAFVSQFSWADMAHEELIFQFAEAIAKRGVDNPVLSDVRTVKASLGVSTPVPFLSFEAAFNHRQMQSVDYEGNLVISKGTSGGVGVKADLAVASARVGVERTAGRYCYYKNAMEQARDSFNELLEEHKLTPEFSCYLSRTASRYGGKAEQNELANYDAFQRKYLCEQKKISNSFSVLLSLDYTTQPLKATDKDDDDWPSALAPSPHRIVLNAIALKTIRPTAGTETTTSGTAAGSVGVSVETLQFKAGLDVRVTKQTKRKEAERRSSLCELLQNQFVGQDDKAAMKLALGQGSAVPFKCARAFWYAAGQSSETELDALYQNIENLRKDVAFYSRLHALGVTDTKPDTRQKTPIDALCQRYGVQSAQACLHCMAILTALFFSQLMDQQPDDATEQQRIDGLKKSLLEQEHALHTSTFPGCRAYLEDHAMGRQESSYSRREKVYQIAVDTGVMAIAGGMQTGIKITTGSLGHSSSLQAGDYFIVEFTLGPSARLNKRTLQSVADSLASGMVGTTGLESDFLTGTYTQSGTYAVRFFRPSTFADLPYTKIFERCYTQQLVESSVTVPVPIAGVVTLELGAGYSESSTQLVSETPSPNTLLYVSMHYMHALASGKTDKSGAKVQDSYWYRIEREHSATLAELFKNCARQARDPVSASSRLIREMNAMEEAWFEHATPTERRTCQAMREAFLSRASLYGEDPSDENYQSALTSFKELQRAWFPLWQKNKEASSVYKKWTLQLH